MYDYGSANNFLNRESLVIKNTVGISLVAEKRGHIAGVMGMCHAAGIVVHSGVFKIIAAVSGFVYVHGIEIAGTGERAAWKPEYFRLHQHAAVNGTIKFDHAAEPGVLRIPSYPCGGVRLIAA